MLDLDDDGLDGDAEGDESMRTGEVVEEEGMEQ